MKQTILCLLLVAFAWQTAAAQATVFRQGDHVVTSDGRAGVIEAFKDQELAKVKFEDGSTEYFMLTTLKKTASENFKVGATVYNKRNGQRGMIEALNGSVAKVRFGPGKYDFQNIPVEMLMSEAAGIQARQHEEDDIKQKPLRAAFEDDARNFSVTVSTLAHAYDPKYELASQFSPEPATYQKFLKDLEGLAAVCRKYPNLTNPDLPDYMRHPPKIRDNPADWCRMAEQRERVVKNIQLFALNQHVETTVDIWKGRIDEQLRNPEQWVKDDMQALLFDRAAWEQKELADSAKQYAAIGERIPASALAPLEEKISELKAKIERDAQTREWKQPQYSDAAFEASVRAAYLKQYPGVKVFKTGMTFATWKAEDDTSLVGQGTGYKVYRTTKGAYRYKLGLALVKLPGQPYCQVRDFEFHQDKAGAGYGAAKLTQPIAYAGMFVKCP